ncbi:MAG: serine hydrolase domain-containing protein [Acidimicrobiales bacterium]
MTSELATDRRDVGVDETVLEGLAATFNAYVADGRLPGWMVTVWRGGRRAWTGRGGYARRASGEPVNEDTLWRIYSMTKPITALLVMGLVDEGLLSLDDEVARWVPELGAATVFVGGTPEEPVTRPSGAPVSVRHLLSHTSGLTYGFTFRHPVDAMYRAKGHLFGSSGKGLSESVGDWCSMPLVFDPGTKFTYSVAFDVLGHLVERVTDRPLDAALRERVLDPLGLSDTDWWCPPEKRARLADLELAPLLASWSEYRIGEQATRWPRMLGAGGGLVSSAADFERVMALMLGRGELDGVRLVAPETFDLMVTNQLPDGGLLEDLAQDGYAEEGYAGCGFGLGQCVVVDAARAAPLSVGTYRWGGAASTHYFVDPREDLAVAFYTQLLPTGTYPIFAQLVEGVYRSLGG